MAWSSMGWDGLGPALCRNGDAAAGRLRKQHGPWGVAHYPIGALRVTTVHGPCRFRSGSFVVWVGAERGRLPIPEPKGVVMSTNRKSSRIALWVLQTVLAALFL